jgi:general secretion pathway protein D
MEAVMTTMIGSLMKNILRLSVLYGALCLTGCAGGGGDSSSLTAAELTANDDKSDQYYMQRMMELRKELREHPSDTSTLAQLRQTEHVAAAHFLVTGQKLLDGKEYARSIQQFELGLVAEPGNVAVQQARVKALKRKESARLLAEEQRAKAVGNLDLAQSLIEQARMIDDGNEALKIELKNVKTERNAEADRFLVRAFNEPTPIAVNFRQAKLRDALKGVAAPYKLNIVYDPSIEDTEVSLSASNISFKQAFSMILQSGGASYKALGSNSILVYQNTPEKRLKYADVYFKTFHLNNIKADKMAEMLKSHLELKNVSVNSELNIVQIRDSHENLDIIEKLIAVNDRMPAEVMLDVEILEISRTKAEALGLDYGTQISISPPAATTTTDSKGNATTTGGVTAAQFVNGQFMRSVLGGASVSLPTVTLKYMQQEVDGRVLAKPSIRTVDGRPAKIHIGDRVPLRSSTVQDVTGQSRTMYEYRDIGIKLEVLPKYHMDDTISVELTMEVSSLGNNLGTVAEPAYAIGTRNINTTMLLREGETAMLGGLIRDDERRTMNKVPGLSDMGVVGKLFTSKEENHDRTDVLLTITPKIIRDQALPRPGGSSFSGGGNGGGATDASFDFLKQAPAAKEPPRFKMKPINADTSAGAPAPSSSKPVAHSGRGAPAQETEPVADAASPTEEPAPEPVADRRS